MRHSTDGDPEYYAYSMDWWMGTVAKWSETDCKALIAETRAAVIRRYLDRLTTAELITLHRYTRALVDDLKSGDVPIDPGTDPGTDTGIEIDLDV